jgi:hypothetical protein
MARLGMAQSTVSSLLSDPDGSLLRARKDLYRGKCQECGGRTDGSNGRAKAPSICKACIEWSEEACIEAIRRWAAEHGGVPPRKKDLVRAPQGYPSAQTVETRIGWNEALLKAGFAVHMDRRPETQAEVERLVAAGLTQKEIAERFGWSPSNVSARLRYRGKSVAQLREAA